MWQSITAPPGSVAEFSAKDLPLIHAAMSHTLKSGSQSDCNYLPLLMIEISYLIIAAQEEPAVTNINAKKSYSTPARLRRTLH